MADRNEDEAEANVFECVLEAACGGDRDALNRLFSECREYLLLVANHELDSALQAKLGASDLVQHTLAEISNNLSQFRGGTREEFLAWLRSALSNDLRDARRRYKSSQRRDVRREKGLNDSAGFQRPLMDRLTTPSSQAMLDEQAELLQLALQQLSESQRQVIQLRNWAQLSFPAIGQQMDISSEAARKTWYRAVLRLQHLLEPQLGGVAVPESSVEGRAHVPFG